jgi:hypothetical protein
MTAPNWMLVVCAGVWQVLVVTLQVWVLPLQLIWLPLLKFVPQLHSVVFGVELGPTPGTAQLANSCSQLLVKKFMV